MRRWGHAAERSGAAIFRRSVKAGNDRYNAFSKERIKAFGAAGAGGVALQVWALRRAGLAGRTVAARMVAFLVLLYSFYALTVAVVGFGLGSDGDESMCYRFNLRGNPFPMISGRTTAPLPPGRQPIMQNCNLQGIRATLPRRRPRVPLSL